jgi:hypothetical protein
MPRTAAQRILRRTLGPRLETGRIVPALAAALATLGLTLLGLLMLSPVLSRLSRAAIPAHTTASLSGLTTAVATLIGGAHPVALLLLALGVPFELTGPGAAGNALSVAAPLTILPALPFALLVLAGVFAGASTFGQHTRHALARGALVGPLWGTLMALLAANASLALPADRLGVAGDVTLSPSVGSAGVSGLVMGTVAGIVGAWLHANGRASLRAVRPAMEALPFPRLIGALAAGTAATLAGLAISCGLGLAVAVWLIITHAGTLATTPGGPLEAVTLVILCLPSLAVWMWSLALGAPVAIDHITYAGSGTFGADFPSFGLAAGQPGWLPLSLLPLILAMGAGSLAVRFFGSRSSRAALVTGALVAPCFAVISAWLAGAATVSAHASAPAGTLIVDLAPGLGQVAGYGLALGLAGGALGGWLTTTPYPAEARARLRTWAGTISWPRLPWERAYAALDALTGKRARPRRTLARIWMYNGVLTAGVLSAAMLLCDGVTLVTARHAPAGALHAVTGTLAALAIVGPLACWAVAGYLAVGVRLLESHE